jgi:hypothetical protein
MKKLVLLLVVFLIPVNLFALEEITSKSKKRKLVRAILVNGYVCSSSNEANYIRQTEGGLMYQVFCDDNTYVYRVILTPMNRYIVETW